MSNWYPRDQYFPDLRHLAILRTSRQIYNEASYILHSELEVQIEARDIIVSKYSLIIWRHDTCYGRGAVDQNGEYVYNTPALGGRLEPPVFARLRRIQYDALLAFPNAPVVYIREDFSIEPQFQRYYMRFIRDANVTYIQRFLKCILHSPIISHLSINFGVHSVAFHLPQGWTFGREVEEMQRAVNRQARDMFVHCGVLGPFRALDNVGSFNLGFF